MFAHLHCAGKYSRFSMERAYSMISMGAESEEKRSRWG